MELDDYRFVATITTNTVTINDLKTHITIGSESKAEIKYYRKATFLDALGKLQFQNCSEVEIMIKDHGLTPITMVFLNEFYKILEKRGSLRKQVGWRHHRTDKFMRDKVLNRLDIHKNEFEWPQLGFILGWTKNIAMKYRASILSSYINTESCCPNVAFAKKHPPILDTYSINKSKLRAQTSRHSYKRKY